MRHSFGARFLIVSVVVATSLATVRSYALGEPILLAQYGDIVGLAASYNGDDGFRRVIVARRNGEIRELFFKTVNGGLATNVGNSVIATVPGVFAVATFYAADDNFRIVLAATADGKVHEIFYHPTKGRGESVIASFPAIRALAGFFDATTQKRVAVILTAGAGAAFHKVEYNPRTGKTDKVIGTSDGSAVAMCANYWQLVSFDSGGRYLLSPLNQVGPMTSSQDGLGDTKAVACGKSGYFAVDRGGIFGNWLRASLPIAGGVGPYGADKQVQIETIAVDSFDWTHVVVSTADGRVLLFVKP